MVVSACLQELFMAQSSGPEEKEKELNPYKAVQQAEHGLEDLADKFDRMSKDLQEVVTSSEQIKQCVAAGKTLREHLPPGQDLTEADHDALDAGPCKTLAKPDPEVTNEFFPGS